MFGLIDRSDAADNFFNGCIRRPIGAIARCWLAEAVAYRALGSTAPGTIVEATVACRTSARSCACSSAPCRVTPISISASAPRPRVRRNDRSAVGT